MKVTYCSHRPSKQQENTVGAACGRDVSKIRNFVPYRYTSRRDMAQSFNLPVMLHFSNTKSVYIQRNYCPFGSSTAQSTKVSWLLDNGQRDRCRLSRCEEAVSCGQWIIPTTSRLLTPRLDRDDDSLGLKQSLKDKYSTTFRYFCISRFGLIHGHTRDEPTAIHQ